MYYDFFDILPQEKKLLFSVTKKFSLPFYYHVVTYLPSSQTTKAAYMHYHDMFEIHYVLEGSYHSIVNQIHYQIPEGEILVICPNDMHDSSFSHPAKTWRIMIQNEHLKSLGISFDGFTIPAQIDHDETMTGFMKEMFLDATQENPVNYVNCYAITLQMMIYLRRHYATPQFQAEKNPSAKLQMVQNAIKYMETHFSEDFSFYTLAKSLGYSQSYFSRTFSEIAGISAAKYLQRLRCTNAKTMLQTGAYTVSEVGERCGFSSPSYFIKIYKQVMGRLPKEDK